MTQKTSYVCSITPEQAQCLRELLIPRGWEFGDAPYAHWKAGGPKVTVVAYQSGKLTVQGKGTAEFVQFILEPEILHEARFGYEDILAEQEKPEMFAPHAGIDESGKGDYFGPLVIAAAYVDESTARSLLKAGVADSKTIKSDRRINDLAEEIRKITRGRYDIVTVGPEAYNRLYSSFRNVNRLLAWGHAKALENLLEKVPDCPRAISDQFAKKRRVLEALQSRGEKIVLEQMPRAESDVAVAAASVLARAEFVLRLKKLGEAVSVHLPKGASAKVIEVASELGARGGRDMLRSVAKLHFKTTSHALG